MNLRKNVAAKVGTVVASLVALLVGWGLVHQNPPPSNAATEDPVASPTTAQTLPQGRNRQTLPPASAPAAPSRTKRTTRTHAS